MAAAADGAGSTDVADATDEGGSVLDLGAYPDRPGARSALAGERYFNAQHTKERLRTTQPTSKGARIFWPIGDIATGKLPQDTHARVK